MAEGIKPCPKCGVYIEKNLGCSHMNCRLCRYQFCWSCGVEFTRGHKWYCSIKTLLDDPRWGSNLPTRFATKLIGIPVALALSPAVVVGGGIIGGSIWCWQEVDEWLSDQMHDMHIMLPIAADDPAWQDFARKWIGDVDFGEAFTTAEGVSAYRTLRRIDNRSFVLHFYPQGTVVRAPRRRVVSDLWCVGI